MSDLAFFGRFGGETARVLKCFASLSPDEVGRRVFDLHQRHAKAISDALKSAVETYSSDLVESPPATVIAVGDDGLAKRGAGP